MQSEASTCRMSGAGAGEPLPGAITLEDLQSMSEAPDEEQEPPQGCDSTHRGGGGSVEDAAGEEQERLLSYWQSVGRGHQVDVPRDMAEPIQQLTRNNHPQRRERIPFTVINRKEKLGEVLYEKRHYEKAKWACVKVQEDQYEQSICLGFMKIMRYICEQNSSGLYLGMTIPIVTIVHTSETTTDITRFVTVAYYLPGELQEQPPEPDDPDIIIEEWPPAIIYARGFRGVTNEDSIAREISLLTELLEHPELCLQDTFIVAGYTNPAAANRQNEIWFFERP
ncbi:heme-binding protein 1-like isoform X2 [Hemicordylus capensis]|uniref:heme-binding protein 1-like isoform X2 n=1 Tax=Hemicordylus capensis TaxID=884348 RepID=UPI002303D385|nr:heme-binding protein 1-like isoform X2 [Hemicordylus capensis]